MSSTRNSEIGKSDADPQEERLGANLGWWQALPHRAMRWVRLTPARRVLALETLLALIRARVWLIWRPFTDISQRLGTPIPKTEFDTISLPSLDESQALQAQEVAMMVRWIARYVPFRAVCLQQAIAAKTMLARRGIPSVLHFGVHRKAESGKIRLRAHAWLAAGTIEVTGFDLAAEYQEIARYI